MLFVPLPLFATLLLGIVSVRFALTHDLRHRAHQLFLLLVALYAVQSLLLSLRWGYGVDAVGLWVALIAPVLPVIAYLSYIALTMRLRGLRLWPLVWVPLNWVVLVMAPQAADAVILVTYLGFGGLLVRLGWLGADQLALSPLGNAREIAIAMGMTGGALIASGLTDIYVIVDFIRNEGRNVGLIVTFVQTAFMLVIGGAAAMGRVAADTEISGDVSDTPAQTTVAATDEDGEIIARLEALFETEGLHKNEELSLRRLARRLQLPDRRVSNAINRVKGMSVSQFVNHTRIQDACGLLKTTDDTVLEISLAAGFASKSNFNREFLRVTGMTPSKWRQAQIAPADA